jgi:hypothetical protein
MAKVIQSPVERWPGFIVLPDSLNYGRLKLWLDAQTTARAFVNDEEIKNPIDYYRTVLIAACACVSFFHLDGLGQLTPETFPATPVEPARALARWVCDCIADLIQNG